MNIKDILRTKNFPHIHAYSLGEKENAICGLSLNDSKRSELIFDVNADGVCKTCVMGLYPRKALSETSRRVLLKNQVEVAKKLGCSVDTVKSWCCGRRNPSEAYLKKIKRLK